MKNRLVEPQLQKCDVPESQRAADLRAVGIAAAAVLVVLIVALPPGPFWLDAPEFIAAAAGWGQVHPPGHPAAMPLLKGFLLLPAGTAAFRANLFSAVFGAVSAGLVGLLAIALAGVSERDGGPRTVRRFGVAATLGFGLCASSVLQSLSVEIYSLNAALALGAVALAAWRPGDARAGGLIGVLLGLGLANHHFLTLLALPAAGAFFIAPCGLRAGVRRALPGLVAAAAVAAGAYLYLPARAGGWPVWADASTVDGVLWIASARVFAGSLGGFEAAGGGLLRNVGLAAGLLADTLTWPGLALAVLGVGVTIATRRGWTAAGLVLLIAGGLASKVSMGLLDPRNPDDHGYFLAAIAGLVAAQAVGARWIADRLAVLSRGAPGRLAAVMALAVAVLPMPAGLATARDRAAFDEAAGVTALFWDDVPPGAVVLVSHYPVHFMALHDQQVEGVRPDVTVVQQSFYSRARGGGFYARRVAERDPDLAPLADAFLARGTLDWRALRALADRRPVRLEADPDLAVPPDDVSAAGWLFALRGASAVEPDPRPDTAAEGWPARLRAALPGWPALQTETRRVVLRQLAGRALWLDAKGLRDAARSDVAAALELNPVDRTLLDLRDRMR